MAPSIFSSSPLRTSRIYVNAVLPAGHYHLSSPLTDLKVYLFLYCFVSSFCIIQYLQSETNLQPFFF
ncbi:hypothetical protein L6452_13849 [Arctium lappa]|uniref:Uncharacterized protein n=1 Tax=Arctium lappa TaxID=4217 RepID=A0ACB9CJG3_ARCLA|nr:hypothetical protein L6452_13849 [Arctium lappa]